MSEEPDAAEQEERNWGTATPEEFRAGMQRSMEDLTNKVNAFIKILLRTARRVHRPARYQRPQTS